VGVLPIGILPYVLFERRVVPLSIEVGAGSHGLQNGECVARVNDELVLLPSWRVRRDRTGILELQHLPRTLSVGALVDHALDLALIHRDWSRTVVERGVVSRPKPEDVVHMALRGLNALVCKLRELEAEAIAERAPVVGIVPQRRGGIRI
jgi:hypothetical protein